MSKGALSIKKNALFGLLSWAVPLVLSFVATPLIVHALGEEAYGVYALVLGFVNYSFTFGIGRVITKYIAEYRSRNENERISEIISATLTLNLIVGLVALASIALTSGYLVTEVLNIRASFVSEANTALMLAGLIIFVTMMNQIGVCTLQGAMRFDVFSKLHIANNFLLLGGNVLLAINGFGLKSLLGWNLCILSVFTLIGLLLARKYVPEFQFKLKFDRSLFGKVFGFSAWIIGYQVLGNILVLFERGYITRRLGSESLTYYVVPMTIALMIHACILSLSLVVFPVASEKSDDKDSLLRLYLRATKLTCIVVFAALLNLLAMGNEFLTLWMGEEFAVEATTLLFLHTITFSAAAVLVISWQMADGLGYPAYNFFVFLVCLFVTLGVMMALVDDYGTTGVAFGRLAGFGVIFLSIFVAEAWFFGKIQFGFWARVFLLILPLALLAGFLERYLIGLAVLSWISFVVCGLVGTAAFGAGLLLTGIIDENDKRLFRGMLKV